MFVDEPPMSTFATFVDGELSDDMADDHACPVEQSAIGLNAVDGVSDLGCGSMDADDNATPRQVSTPLSANAPSFIPKPTRPPQVPTQQRAVASLSLEGAFMPREQLLDMSQLSDGRVGVKVGQVRPSTSRSMCIALEQEDMLA